MTHPSRSLLTGLFWAVLAILIWSGSLVLIRFGVTTGLTAHDLTALRFGVAAALLFPVLLRGGGGARPGPWVALLLVVSFGAPYILLLSLAMQWVPASAAGAVNPGTMAIAALLLARVADGRPFPLSRLLGMALTLLGLGGFMLTAGGGVPGYAILILTGGMWAIYGRAVRRWEIPALRATAMVATGSALLYLPVYLVALPTGLAEAALPEVLLQAAFQGVLVSVVAVYAFSRSVELLGPVAGPSLPALIPVVTLGLDTLILGEPMTPELGAGAVFVTLGLLLVLAPATGLVRLIPRRALTSSRQAFDMARDR